MDCLVKVSEKVGMESLLLDVPFVCKSWYKATLNSSCWQSLIFPDNELIFVSEYQIDGDCCSVITFLKFMINRSSRNATVLKLTKCRTVEALEFAANVCPGLVTLSLSGDVLDNKHTNLELIWQVEKFGDLSKGSVQGREASSIVKLVPYQVLKFEGCKS
ncbi:unnamed protein product [Prunus armeniaca]